MFVFLCLLLVTVTAHMAISNPVPLDAVIGDAYRHPVTSDNNPTDGGTCHGQMTGATYAWVWTPTSSGTCEMYQSCFDTLPESGTLTMSFGAAHDGGPCKLYSCPNGVTSVPNCDRSATGVAPLPHTYDDCTSIASTPDCTLLGSMDYNGAGEGTPVDVQPELPEDSDDETVGNDDATPTKIRCGTSWTDANSRCGTLCTTNSDCTVNGESCFAALADCATPSTVRCGTSWTDANNRCGDVCAENTDCTVSGEFCYADVADCPEEAPVREERTSTPDECVSAVSYITDEVCQLFACDTIYVDAGYCKTSGASASSPTLTYTCILYAAFEGETWGDVAIKYDVSLLDLLLQNPTFADDPLEADTVVEIPGDCTTAQREVMSGAAVTQLLLLPLLAPLLAFF